MPTGYTALIEDHDCATFNQFVWRCARATGALVTMRGDSLDADVPDKLAPSDYHEKKIEWLKGRLAELSAMTDEQADVIASKEHHRDLVAHKKSVKNQNLLLERYKKMRMQVQRWTPPSPDHDRLKAFMLEQLEIGSPYSGPFTEPKLLAGGEWRKREIDCCAKDLAYHQAKALEEQVRCDQRNRWIQQLRESVPYESQPK